jgi:Fe(3+) dicitrate transport protein
VLGEVFHYGADGFKTLNSGQDTGFEKTDGMLKIDRYFGENNEHHLEFKGKYSEETSNETYLGLLDNDYNADAYQRYSASQLDQMDTEHTHLSLHYDYIISPQSDISIIAYQNDFARNWYKVSKVGGLSLGSGAEEVAAQIDNGSYTDSAFPIVQIKANNREYLSQGIQAELAYRTDEHDIRFGVRIHEDEMDRYQWVDDYTLTTAGTMSLLLAREAGTDSNRIDSADAISLFIHDTWEINDLTIKGGLRYENVNLARDDWGKTDPQRVNEPAMRRNSVEALLPALGLTYQVNDELVILASVQRSFAPPAPGNQNAEEEDGWNAEAGVRFIDNDLRVEAIAFATRLDNLHGNCTASQGCNDSLIGNQYNAGKVSVDGIELSLGNAWQIGAVQIPINVNYTYTNASFDESFASELDSWGDVEAGDDLPYLPQTVMQIETGVKSSRWQVLASLQRLDDMRTQAGNGAMLSDTDIKGRTVVNLSAKYDIDNVQQVYAVIDNVLDKNYIATRQHGAIQVGKPRTLQIGYRVSF